jgi:hypothetical protein
MRGVGLTQLVGIVRDHYRSVGKYNSRQAGMTAFFDLNNEFFYSAFRIRHSAVKMFHVEPRYRLFQEGLHLVIRKKFVREMYSLRTVHTVTG